MKELLEKVDSVFIIVDLWSNRLMKEFLGMTCPTFTNLECNRFRGEHNGENIAQNYEELISFYKLKGKVIHIVTDNASNMLKAFRLPGFDVLIADELDSEPSDEEDEVDIQSVDVTNSLSYLPEHDSCFIHTLQLVVKDGFKQAGIINKVLAKTANIVSHVRRSIHANDILEGKKGCKQRW